MSSPGKASGDAAAQDAVDGARMAVGMLTVVPVRVDRVDRPVAGWAMLWAPPLGALLGLASGAVAVAGAWLGLAGTLAALLGVALAALLTRGLHLDGLADLADGFGSGRPANEALTVMRQSDIGPFGVITLILVLGAQVLALGQLVTAGPAAALVAGTVAGATGRLAVTLACTRGVPGARSEGLGAYVAGTVGRPAAAIAFLGVGALSLAGWFHAPLFAVAIAAAVLAGLLVAGLLLYRAVRRLGGITGDVLGALVESAAAAVLVAAAAAAAWV